jgi:hypothetical protein
MLIKLLLRSRFFWNFWQKLHCLIPRFKENGNLYQSSAFLSVSDRVSSWEGACAVLKSIFGHEFQRYNSHTICMGALLRHFGMPIAITTFSPYS